MTTPRRFGMVGVTVTQAPAYQPVREESPEPEPARSDDPHRDRWLALAEAEEETASELEAQVARGEVVGAMMMDATLDLIAESRDLAARYRRRV